METPSSNQPAADEGAGSELVKTLAGGDFAAKLDALFDRHFRGTRMGNDTDLWNQCMAFKADVGELFKEVGSQTA